ncbi:hypothetical protein AV929_00150 [Haloarcula sp. K1]|nr:hypothetical protein AV929_00150 [Haloarcula sp. K1]
MTELGSTVTARTQRDDVVQRVCVSDGERWHHGEQPNRHDVMDVRVPTQFVGSSATQHASVVVPRQGLLAHRPPSRSVLAHATAAPVRMPVTGERRRKPLRVAVTAAEDDFTLNLTRISLNAGVANVTGDR